MKARIIKRTLSMLLTLAMLFGMLPLTASAEDQLVLQEPDNVVEKLSDEEMDTIEADEILWVTNEEGTDETQEIFHLPEDGSLPEYIESVEYPDVIPQEAISEDEGGIMLLATNAYESEPNDLTTQANTYTIGSDMYGAISSMTDVDYFKVDFKRDGKATVYLGDIPAGCNYDLKIYYQPRSGGTVTLYKTIATTNSYEQIRDMEVENDKVYYIQVYPATVKYSSSRYYLRTTFTAEDDTFEPNNTLQDSKTISTNTYVLGTIHKATDVDYYTITPNSGVLNITLSSIPSTCDYRFVVYNSSNRVVAETTQNGNKDKSLSITVPSGKYFIKVYSSSGSDKSKEYRLTVNYRTLPTTVSGYIRPKIRAEEGMSATSTPIDSLPIQLIYTNGSTEYTVASTTTNSSGYFSASFALPTVITGKLYVKTIPDDSTLSCQKLDNTIPTTLFEIPISTGSISIDINEKSSLTDQFLVTMTLWRNAKRGLTALASNSSRSRSKLIILCTAGSTPGCSTSPFAAIIKINGDYQRGDYSDYNTILHEMGHWEMTKNGGGSVFAAGDHNWANASNVLMAYSEGWAHYFSCLMRNDSYRKNYWYTSSISSSTQYYGCNLANGQVKPDYGASFYTLPLPTTYTENAKYEINVASALWNLSKINSQYTKFSYLENIMARGYDDWEAFYAYYIENSPASFRESIWNTCEKFHVAYDYAVPNVSLSVSGLTAQMTATDDVAVKKYEWYVDGIMQKSGEGASATLNLGSLNLAAGSHTVECRVYDPEGLATPPRPRAARYGTASWTFTIANSTTSIAATYSSNQSLLQAAPNAGTLKNISTELESGDIGVYSISVPANMDLTISAAIQGAVKTIEIIDPDGTVYDEISYIAPDAPITIRNAKEGDWGVRVINYTNEELCSITKMQYGLAEFDNNFCFPEVHTQIMCSVTPSVVSVDLPYYTNDPNILADFFDDPTVSVSENGKEININTPLKDGLHTFSVMRNVNGLESIASEYQLTVDTEAPVITLNDFVPETSRDRFVLNAHFSEEVSAVFINGNPVKVGYCNVTGFCDCFMLTLGESEFSIEVVDLAGNRSCETFSVIRTE